MTTDLFFTLRLLDCFPDLRLTADVSHYLPFPWRGHFLAPLPASSPLHCAQGAKARGPGRTDFVRKGRVVFGAMDEVVFGTPAAEAIPAQMDRLQLARAFLMVSGTLNRDTDEIEKIRKRSGRVASAPSTRCRAHTPREGGDRRHRTGPRRQCRYHRHRRRRLDHRRRQGGAALPRQRYPHRRRHRNDPRAQGRGAADEAAVGAPDQRAHHHRRRRLQRRRRRHQRAHPCQGNGAP